MSAFDRSVSSAGGEERRRAMRQACGGDSKTALPWESQKDKHPNGRQAAQGSCLARISVCSASCARHCFFCTILDATCAEVAQVLLLVKRELRSRLQKDMEQAKPNKRVHGMRKLSVNICRTPWLQAGPAHIRAGLPLDAASCISRL